MKLPVMKHKLMYLFAVHCFKTMVAFLFWSLSNISIIFIRDNASESYTEFIKIAAIYYFFMLI